MPQIHALCIIPQIDSHLGPTTCGYFMFMSVVSSQETLADALKAGIGGLTYKEPLQGVFAECTAAVAELKTDEVTHGNAT